MNLETGSAPQEHISVRELGNIIDRTNLDTPAGKALVQAFNMNGIDFNTAVIGNIDAWVADATPEDLSELFGLYETLIKHTVSEPGALREAAKAFVDKLGSL